MATYLDFENGIKQIDEDISNAKIKGDSHAVEILEKSLSKEISKTYKTLSEYQKLQLARHPDRPYALDYIRSILHDSYEIHGDRNFADDAAIVSYIGYIGERKVIVVGEQKGRGTKNKIKRNFGMPHPEGYRKIQRLLLQAEKFNRPVLMFVDTPGAYPGIGAEQRGQGSAIAHVLMTLSRLRVPTLSVVIGQGGSGGALALAFADRLLMLSNAMFAVASPEACSSIIWKDTDRVEEMAAALKITAEDLMELDLIDEIIEEPLGGAHLDPTACFASVATAVSKYLTEIKNMKTGLLLSQRTERIRSIGQFISSVEEKGPFLTD